MPWVMAGRSAAREREGIATAPSAPVALPRKCRREIPRAGFSFMRAFGSVLANAVVAHEVYEDNMTARLPGGHIKRVAQMKSAGRMRPADTIWVDGRNLAGRVDIRVNATRSRMIVNALRDPAIAGEEGLNHRAPVVSAAKDSRSVGRAIIAGSIIARTIHAFVLSIGRGSQRCGENRQRRDRKLQSHDDLLISAIRTKLGAQNSVPLAA